MLQEAKVCIIYDHPIYQHLSPLLPFAVRTQDKLSEGTHYQHNDNPLATTQQLFQYLLSSCHSLKSLSEKQLSQRIPIPNLPIPNLSHAIPIPPIPTLSHPTIVHPIILHQLQVSLI